MGDFFDANFTGGSGSRAISTPPIWGQFAPVWADLAGETHEKDLLQWSK
jgi:hypothetical protein